VTDLSGRGIGMEVVKREVLALGGTIKVSSELYRGVRFDIKIPYTLDLHARVLPPLPMASAEKAI
jgi:two-component system chemotaxis sensor kinase CheA